MRVRRPFGSLDVDDLTSAAAVLTTFDDVLVIGEDSHNDVVMHLSMGWPRTLTAEHRRQ